ncbi:LysR family transcriptional regulator [Parasalinivibrio latis]|uniref:LysR family transcriptional regulator n=1 Tax=Parasalinivibrio latis TaxID=2952610 RepID=UPI0030E0408E
MVTNKLMVLMPEMAVFVTVIEEGSFARTAIRLGVAPSSVSRSISRLENALEKKLIARTTRKLSLTPVGEEVFGLCKDMLQSAKQAVDAAQSEEGEVSGVIRFAAPKALSRQVLMPIVLEFIETHPDISVHFKVIDHYIDPVSDEVDVVIHITNQPVEGLVAKKLGSTRLVVCATPAYLLQHGTPELPGDLARHNCICLGEMPADRSWKFTKDAKDKTVTVGGSLTVNHSEIRREAVLRGLGISIFPEFVIADYIASGKVIEVLSDWYLNGRYQGDIVAQYPYSKFVPNQVKVFLAFLSERWQA